MLNVTEEKNVLVELLRNRYKKDLDFRKVIDEANLFYGRKVIGFAIELADQQFVEAHMLEVVSDQFFQGYFLMNQILSDEEFSLEENYWSLANGYVRNNVYPLLESIMEESGVQWQQSAAEKLFTKRVVANFYEAYDVMVQLRKDVLALGAYYAFIEHPKYQKPVHPNNTLKLASPFDLTFLNPQVFMQTQYVAENVEKWVLYQAQTIKGSQWVGDIQLAVREGAEGGLENHLEILLSDLLEQNDRTDIINQMISKIPAEEHSHTHIQFYLVSSKKEYTLNV